MERFLTVKDVSEITGIRETTIRAWIFQRKIPFVRIGRLVRIKQSDFNEWIGRSDYQKPL